MPAMVFVVAMGWMSMRNASLRAAVVMLATGGLTMTAVAQSIDWGTLIVIACASGSMSAARRIGHRDC